MTEWRPRPRRHPVPRLALAWRVFFVASGWILVLVGVAGLALPGIQGVLTLVLGGALLSLASETAYWFLRWVFQRWPRGWRRLEKARRRIYARLGAEGSAPEGNGGAGASPPAAPPAGRSRRRVPPRARSLVEQSSEGASAPSAGP